MMSLISGFAAFALFLSLLGIYGVSAFAAHQRGHEVAIRMAIGASKGDIIRMFLRETTFVLAIGIAIGSFAAAAVADLLRTQIFGVEPFDLSTVVASAAVMAAAGLAATWWPANRVAGQSPRRALNES
jgi:putative ABC transport system permease protein